MSVNKRSLPLTGQQASGSSLQQQSSGRGGVVGFGGSGCGVSLSEILSLLLSLSIFDGLCDSDYKPYPLFFSFCGLQLNIIFTVKWTTQVLFNCFLISTLNVPSD
ncbi:hypothetical protein ACOSQ3_011034 [Xanthoceras sorbifolium]